MIPIVRYHREDNAAYIRLSPSAVLESEEVAPGVVFDYDAEGRIVGIELLDAKAQLSAELLAEGACSARRSQACASTLGRVPKRQPDANRKLRGKGIC